MKKRIYAMILSAVMAMAGTGAFASAEEIVTNQDYSQDFNTTEAGTLPAEWKLVSDNANIRVESIDTENQATEKQGLHFGTGDYNTTSGTAYLSGYVWNRFEYTLGFSVRNRQASGGPVKAYFNYSEDAYYAVRFYKNSNVSLVKKEAEAEETVVALSESTYDLWNYVSFTVVLKDGRISVMNGGTEIISYTDESPVQSGGIAFGADKANGYIDDISIISVKANENYSESFNSDITDVPSCWVASDAVNILNGNLHMGFSNEWNPGDGKAYLNNYIWDNCQYSFSFFLSNRITTAESFMYAYFNYTDADNYYAVKFPAETAAVTLVKKVNGQETELAVGSTVTDIYHGKNFTLWFDPTGKIALKNDSSGTTVLSYTDSLPLTSGTIGFAASQSNGYINNIAVNVQADNSSVISNAAYTETFDGTEIPANWNTENCSIDANGKRFKLASWSSLNSNAIYTGHQWTNQNYTFKFDGWNEAADSGNIIYIYFDYSSFAGTESAYKLIWYGNGQLELKKTEDGTAETLASGEIADYTGKGTRQKFEINRFNGEITVSVNGNNIIKYTDETPLSGGNIGFGTKSSVGYIDSIRVYIPEARIVKSDVVDSELNEIDSLSGMQGMTVKVQLEINSDNEVSPIIAVSDNDSMLYTVGIASSSDNKYECSISIPQNTPDDAKITVYLWSDNLIPYADSKVILY